MKPAMPGQRHRRARIRHQAKQDGQVDRNREQGVEAGTLVVDQHEEGDEGQSAGGSGQAGANRIGAK
jgi:hypothetical protein